MKISIINKLTKLTPFFISAASLIFAAQFLYHTLDSSFTSRNIFWIFLTGAISLLVFIGLRSEILMVREIKIKREDFRFPILLKSFLVILSSALLTFLFAGIFSLTTIFAASLICVIYTFIFPNHQPEAYSGTVAGMIGAYLCESWVVALTTAFVTGLVFILFKPYFNGVGGRGGSIPYVATTLVIRLVYDLTPRQQAPFDETYLIPALFTLVGITFLTYILQEKGILTIVRSAMIIALLFSIVIPIEHYTLTTAMFAGTVVGMSSSDRIENYNQLLIISLLCYVLFIPSYHILDGIGGKIGILCLLAYYGSIGFQTLVEYFFKKSI